MHLWQSEEKSMQYINNNLQGSFVSEIKMGCTAANETTVIS